MTRYVLLSEHRQVELMLDFAVNRFFMKFFKSSNIAVINECQKMFSFQLLSERLSHRMSRFLSKVALIDNNFIKYTTHV